MIDSSCKLVSRYSRKLVKQSTPLSGDHCEVSIMSTPTSNRKQQQQRPACGWQQIKQNTTVTQKLYSPGRQQQQQQQGSRMKILSIVACCCLISMFQSSQAQEVQQQQTTTTAAPTTTTTTPASTREESNKMTTITIFKIHKEALLNDNSNSSTALQDTQQHQQQSWLIQKSDLPPTTFQSPATVTPAPVAAAAAAATSSSRTPSVLRPSIEEVASKLSRKHLNLEHDNWRLRQQQQQPVFDDTTRSADNQPASSSPAATVASAAGGGGSGVEAEQDIVQVSTDKPNTGTLFSASTSSPALLREGHREHYLHVDRAAAAAASASASATATNQPKSRQPSGGRRKKTFLTGEPLEMSQCHQYLRIYNAPTTSTNAAQQTGAPIGFYQMISNQQLPCTCEMRQEVSWLSCDHVQLIGGYLHPSSNSSSGGADTWDMGKVSATTGSSEGPVQVSRFSQRRSGLQTLHAQKFLNLQLTNLKTIDLSDNRIRQIKVDAFHGLEQSLERLNLANNLLGDSRAISSSNSNNEQQKQQQQSKLIFFTDEFNRLKKLNWLSLRNNRINQLSSTIFTKHQTTISFTIQQQDPTTGKLHASISSSSGSVIEEDAKTTSQARSELIYLDLSENILKQVPSEAISELNGLQTLNLSKNKLLQLDQSSKFPKSLKYLDLSENLIKIIRNCDLIDLPDLIELNLSHNQLSHLDKTAFLSSVAPPPSTLQSSSNSSPGQHHDQSALASSSGNSGESPLSSLQSSTNNLIHEQVQSSSSQLLALGQTSQNSAKSLLPPTSSEGESHVLPVAQDTQAERNRRTRRDVAGVGHEGIVDSDIEDTDPLDAEESAPLQQQRQQQTNQRTLPSDDDDDEDGQTSGRRGARPARQREFNSTIRLNLAYNYFTNLPGDSLLKFSNLQQLDISYNRIRYLDSNYLCSIYNLVESLRELDLSGNLLALPQQANNDNNSSTLTTGEGASFSSGARQLNKLFGCLQKLERLSLATNRPLSSTTTTTTSTSPDSKLRQDESLASIASEEEELDELEALPSSTRNSETSPDARLHIKFGDNHGSRHLQQLDLSDNQLRTMPLIEQVFQQPQVQLSVSGRNSTTDQQQQQLNQWMASRVYLVSLNVSYNYIDRLEERDFDHLFSLRYLSFDFNRLQSLPTRLMRKFTSLDRASFEGNRLSSLEPLNELFERSVRTLRYLNLANNHLTIWPAISERPTLTSRRSEEDNKQTQPLQFVLEELNLEGNLFTSSNVSSLFDQFAYMKSLRSLNLSQNLLNRVRSDWFKFANENLRTLLLTGNKINSIDLGSFAYNQLNELQQLSLAHNLLKELKRKTFDSLPKLRELDLSHNFLHTINSETFNQMSSMQVLNLSNNKLTSWKCEYFSNLCNSISGNINADLNALLSVATTAMNLPESDRQQVSALVELDLSHNSLSQLRVNSISVHTKLERLNLAHNKLSYIPHDLFKANILDSKTTTGKQIQLVSSLKYLNLAHNRIQTVDNINLRPLRNLIDFDLSQNELQTLGVDVILIENNSQQQRDQRNIIVSNNVTNLLVDNQQPPARQPRATNHQQQTGAGSNGLPALGKLRHLNLAHNQLTQVNQSLLHELSPFVLLNLNLSHNYLESESLPYGFYAKISASQPQAKTSADAQNKAYDLVFTLKLESLDLSHNRLNEFPVDLLENHHISMESCNLAHNRIQNLAPNSNILIQIKSLNLEFNPLNRESNELILFEHKSVRHLNLAATRLYAIKEVSNNLATDSKQMLAGSTTTHKHRLLVANQTSQLDLIRSISKPIDAPYVQCLNLSSNQLVWLAANIFERMHSLETLDLSNNQLTRLHLLTNQLAPLSASLENLNLASNLFTSVDATDFGQLSRLRRLDLSSLLSLQKLNCRFLAKLTTLKSLRLFNFPQVRQNLNNILTNLQARQQQQHQQDSHGQTDRMVRKLQQELLMSTLGRHCFRDDSAPTALFPLSDRNQRWFNLEELELELFNAFDSEESMAIAIGGKLSGAFQLGDDLGQFLGPQMSRLNLFGLNLTNLGDDSLLGVTSQQLDLKISYTSMTRLPLEQVLNGVSKRTKLNLDFRNNNIQSLDVRTLQALDELQLNNQILKKGDHASLRLGSNPMRCDCQTRPLWLWLNQRWAAGNSEQLGRDSSASDDAVEMQTSSANYWLKFSSSISQTSDIRCHYPAKLRGKLAQHVNYQDLVCKGGSSNSQPRPAQQRKRNETLRDYYSKELADIYATDAEADNLESDYLDSEETSVRVTKFNRFPSMLFNQTIYYLQSIPVPFILDHSRSLAEEFGLADSSSAAAAAGGRVGKRDGNSVPIYPIMNNQADLLQHPPLNTRHYSRHRPNTQQRHSSFDTLSSLKQFQPAHHHSNNSQRQTILTESDVYILTVMSVAMSLMSFVIIAICLFKYKMDRSDKERILTDHGKMLMSQALFDIHQHQQQSFRAKQKSTSSASPPSSSSSSSSAAAAAANKRATTPPSSSANDSHRKHNKQTTNPGGAMKRIHIPHIMAHHQQQQRAPRSHHPLHRRAPQDQQVLVHLRDAGQTVVKVPAAAAAQNFLMRSPTIRRMQGLATNASDWFKYTLRAYPANAAMHRGQRRRRLFLGDTVPVASQLTTGKRGIEEQLASNEPGSPATLAVGCPQHAFKAVDKLRDNGGAGKDAASNGVIEEKCLHCARLLATIQQTKVQYLIGKSNQQDKVNPAAKAQSKNQDEFVPPSLIRALAEQLDQANAESNYVALGPEWLRQHHQKQQPSQRNELDTSSSFYKRNVRSMRTFGMAGAKGETSKASAEDSSQIPSSDVIGRFAYQSDSQVDTPTPYDPANRCSSMLGGGGGSSHLDGSEDTTGHYNTRDGVFILVPDDNSTVTTNVDQEQEDTSGDEQEPVSVLLNNNKAQVQRETDQQEESIRMQDECSQSSSPVAYGFMRASGPSSLASSSIINHHHQQQQQQHINLYQSSDDNNSSHYQFSTSNNNNNNIDNYSVIRKTKRTETAPTTTTTANNEQVIISRL